MVTKKRKSNFASLIDEEFLDNVVKNLIVKSEIIETQSVDNLLIHFKEHTTKAPYNIYEIVVFGIASEKCKDLWIENRPHVLMYAELFENCSKEEAKAEYDKLVEKVSQAPTDFNVYCFMNYGELIRKNWLGTLFK